MSKEIKFGVEGRAAMLRGVDLLANTVQVRSVLMGYVSVASLSKNIVLTNRCLPIASATFD
jgi:hypothetical protein